MITGCLQQKNGFYCSTTADIYAHLDHNAQQVPANTMNGMFIRGAKDRAEQAI